MIFDYRRDNWGVVLLLTGVVFLVYGNALFNQFTWDDDYLIVSNPYIKDMKFIPNLFAGDLIESTTARDFESGYYRPLSMLWFLVDYQIWKLNPFGFHLTNILIHLVNSVLVFLIIFRMSQHKFVSLLTALFFAVHPIHVEAVVPIYNRMGIQTALCTLAAFLSFLQADNFRRTGWLTASLIFFVLGLFSKEDVIVLPVIFLCYDFVCLSGLKLRGLLHRPKVLFYSACILLCVIYFFIRNTNVHYRFFHPVSPELLGVAWAKNLFYHILTIVKIVGICLSKMVFPFPLSPVYWIEPVNRFLEREVVVSLLVMGGLLGLAHLSREKNKISAFFILFFFISILPASNILPIAEVYTFRERFLYVPSVVICFFMAVICFWSIKRIKAAGSFRRMIYLIPAVLLTGMSIFTVISNYTWRNNLSLWRYAVKADPLSQLAHLNLGEAYLTIGRIPEAVAELNKSLAVPRPQALSSVYLAKLNLVTIDIDMGAYQKAWQELKDALTITKRIGLNPASAYDKLGLLYAKTGDSGKAEENFKQALAHNPQFLTARYNLAVLYFSEGQYRMAEEQLRHALADKDFSGAAYLLGLTLLAQDKREEAKAMFEHVLRIDPKYILAKEKLNVLRKGP